MLRPRRSWPGTTACGGPGWENWSTRWIILGKLIRKLAEAGKAYYSVTWVNLD